MQFAYSAKSLQGQMSNGVLDADTLAVARQLLRERSLFPLTLAPLGEAFATATAARPGLFKKKVSRSEIMLLTSQLLIMCRAGVDLAESLRNVAVSCRNPTLKLVLNEIYQDVAGGQSFSVAMKRQSKMFGEAYVASMAAGEAGGNVPEVLERMEALLKNEIKLRTTVISAMAYPIVLIVVCLIVTSALFLFVLPRFERVFQDMGVTPPASTAMLISFSKELQERAWLWGGLLIGGAIVFFKFLWTEQIRRRIDTAALRLMLIGDVLQSLICGRLLVMLGTMLQSGVPLIQSLQLCRTATRSVSYRGLLNEMEEEVLNGRTIGRVFTNSLVVPAGAAQMVGTAEQSGKLGTVMQLVGDYYEAEGQRKIQELAKMLEPAIIIVMGVIVAFVVASIMLPLLDISSAAGQ